MSPDSQSLESTAHGISALAAKHGFGTVARIPNAASGDWDVVNTTGVNNYHTYTAPAGAAGTGLFASKDFEAGELVLKLETDVTSVLDTPKLGSVCEYCFITQEDLGEPLLKLRKCGACAVVRYCSPICQKLSWEHHHKYECKIFKELYPNILPNTVRLLVRLLLCRHRQCSVLPSPDFGEFMRLQHHLDDFKAQESPDSQNTWENIQLMARAAKEYSGTTDDVGRVEGMVGRILINSLTLVTATYTSLGLSLSPTAALLNHSCTPNTCISFNNATLSVRALSPIGQDTELTISYIDITNPAPMRRAELRARYFFACTCPSCSADPPLTLGRVDPPPALTSALSPTQLEGLETRARQLLLDSQSPSILDGGPSARLVPLYEALVLFKPYVAYPPYRQPLAAVRAELILVLLAAQQWIPALVHSLIAYFHADPFLFPESIHPVRTVHKWVLLKLILHVTCLRLEGDATVKAFEDRWDVPWGVVVWGLFKEVEGNIPKSHGESRFQTEVMVEGDKFRAEFRFSPYGPQGPPRKVIKSARRMLREVADLGEGWLEKEKEKETRL